MRIRNVCLAVLLTFVVVLTASAQSLPRGVSVGVKGGFNQVTVNNDLSPPAMDFRGLVAGGFVTLPLRPLVSIQAEALYSMRRWSLSQTGGTQSIHTDDLVVPLLARVAIGNRGPFVVAGPEFSFDIRSQGTLEVGSNRTDFSLPKFNDIGLAFGAGADFRPLLIELRYTVGLRNLVPEAPRGMTKRRTVAITAGVRLPL